LPAGPLTIVNDYLGRVVAAIQAKTDADLLALYLKQRDEEAFAAIVQRHGPMVLGVCRRALGQSADAEDAFQATFLALSRNASKVGESVPGWLYRVALRTSRKALRRLPTAVPESADGSDPFGEVEWRELRRLIDDELDRLPAKWRTPLVLCYLEGQTRDEAASELGVSLRTLHRRLDEGRSRLRRRLEKRGLAPALLATAVLSLDELRASVPASLAGRAVSLINETTVPSAIRALKVSPTSLRGLTMKMLLCGLLLAGGAIAIMGDRQRTDACPPTRQPSPPVLVKAPLKKESPDDPLAMPVAEAQKKAVDNLKICQKDQGGDIWNWENDQINVVQPGGSSCLAMLALLESGVKVDDKVVARGMKYIRGLEAKNTYVVSLQTQFLCKANQKEDADLIRRNVKWLEDVAVWNAGSLQGWSYSANAGNRADNSNTRYAIAGLVAAHKAGFKVKKEKFWEAVREFYIRSQTNEGGWTYQSEAKIGKGSHTMTASGVLCLVQADEIIGKQDKASTAAIKNGRNWLAKEFTLENSPHTLYNFDVIAALGRASGEKYIGEMDKKHDWYKEGAEWLLKNQKAGGEWQLKNALDQFPVISTSFALRFLASRPD
jgi:RNA polymerase sigma factor (sigma-70 family)